MSVFSVVEVLGISIAEGSFRLLPHDIDVILMIQSNPHLEDVGSLGPLKTHHHKPQCRLDSHNRTLSSDACPFSVIYNLWVGTELVLNVMPMILMSISCCWGRHLHSYGGFEGLCSCFCFCGRHALRNEYIIYSFIVLMPNVLIMFYSSANSDSNQGLASSSVLTTASLLPNSFWA